MQIAITGGSGLIGRALAAELVAAGHDVTVLSRNPDSLEGMPRQVELARWDARSADLIGPLVESADGIVHLAGESIAAGRWTEQRKRSIRDSRVASTRALAEAVVAARKPPSVVVQGSAVGYYGSRGDQEIDEEQPPGDDFLASVCRSWEEAGQAISAAGIRRPVLRTGIVLSNEGGALPRMALPFRLFAGGPAGDGRQWMPWIHIRDQVAAMQWLLEHSTADGPFNLTAPNPVTNREFSTCLGRTLHRPSFMPAPGFALRAALGEMADLILTGQRAVPGRLLAGGFRFHFSEIEAALRDLFT